MNKTERVLDAMRPKLRERAFGPLALAHLNEISIRIVGSVDTAFIRCFLPPTFRLIFLLCADESQ